MDLFSYVYFLLNVQNSSEYLLAPPLLMNIH